MVLICEAGERRLFGQGPRVQILLEQHGLFRQEWLDLTRDPVVISVPDTYGRYYLLQLLDMWTDSVAGAAKRTMDRHLYFS